MWMSEDKKPFCKPWGEVDDEPISLLNNGFASSYLRRPARYVGKGGQQNKKKRKESPYQPTLYAPVPKGGHQSKAYRQQSHSQSEFPILG